MVTIWKCLVQPKLDYCSQLWTPSDQESVNCIQGVQYNFLSKVAGCDQLDHWQLLQQLHLYSQERRRERYVVIFLWKIAEGLVRGYSVDFKSDSIENSRRGRLAQSKPYIRSAPAAVRRARESSLHVKGCRLFNLLPPQLRNMSGCSVDIFKKELDYFLATVPDQPTAPDLTRAAFTNSLIDQLAMMVGSRN